MITLLVTQGFGFSKHAGYKRGRYVWLGSGLGLRASEEQTYLKVRVGKMMKIEEKESGKEEEEEEEEEEEKKLKFFL